MVQSIELLLDAGTEQAVRSSWHALGEAGLPSLATHRSESNRPHVTLAVAEAGLDPALAAVRTVLRGWTLGASGPPATVGSVVLFGGHRHRWVVARPLVATKALLTLHDAVHAAIERAAPDAEVDPQTRPGSWMPHVTLARRLPADDLAAALALLDPAPLHGRFAAARFWDSVPAEVTPL